MLVILPAIGERLICTSSGERKMLTSVGEFFSSGAMGLIRVTRPSAGATTTSSSRGTSRSGSRKKNAMKRATTRKNNERYHGAKASDRSAKATGTTMYGILSRTILNASFLKGRSYVAFITVLQKGDVDSSVPRPQSISSFCGNRYPYLNDSCFEFFDIATSSNTFDL